MRTLRLVVFGLLCATALGADEVVLKSGRTIRGVVVEETATTIVLDIGAGQVGFPRSGVARVVKGHSAVAEYRQRAEALRPDDIGGWLALGQWARDRDLITSAAEAFERVVALDPGNRIAHEALGHEFVAGAWLVGDEARRARGLVPFEGDWVTPAEQRARLAEREADRRERRERAEDAARTAEAEARAREAEARAKQAEAEARIDSGIPIGYGGWYGGGWAPTVPCPRGDCWGRVDGDRRGRGHRPPRPVPTPQPTPRPKPPCTGILANCN